MKHICFAMLCTAVLCGGFSTACAENLLSITIGPSWPQALLNTGIPSGDAELEYGLIVDRRIGFGVAADFLWNVLSKESKDSSGTHYQTLSAQKTFMFPIMGFFMFDPVPDLIVHPVARFQIGYNSMIYSYNVATGTTPSPVQTLSPYFYGLIIKAGVDALYNIGERSALFLGLEYQWADTKTTSNTNGLFDKRDMSGVGIRAGFRVTL